MDIELADRLAIRDLVDRFSLAVTARDQPAICAVFTQSAQWSVGKPAEMAFGGDEQIGAGIVAGLNNFEFLVQMVHSVVIDLAGDRAQARCVIQEVGRFSGGASGIQMLGIYHDELQRGAQGWRFTRRFFQPICMDMTAPAGMFAGAASDRS
jgi:hypothetical protein